MGCSGSVCGRSDAPLRPTAGVAERSAKAAVSRGHGERPGEAALAIGPPYVLVGHSWGGVVARVFALRHPADVCGLVFVDATHEIIESRGLALLPVMYGVMSLAARFGPGRRWLLRQLCPPQASPAYRFRFEQRVNDPSLWAMSIRTARAEGGGIRESLIPASGHQLPIEAPDAVIDAIAGVLEAVRVLHDSSAVPALGESPTP